MDDIQERLEHYEAKDRERRKRETEIRQISIQLFAYARKRRYTLGEKFYRKFAQHNARILDYGKTYGAEAQKRLLENLDDDRTKYLARVYELEEVAENEIG